MKNFFLVLVMCVLCVFSTYAQQTVIVSEMNSREIALLGDELLKVYSTPAPNCSTVSMSWENGTSNGFIAFARYVDQQEGIGIKMAIQEGKKLTVLTFFGGIPKEIEPKLEAMGIQVEKADNITITKGNNILTLKREAFEKDATIEVVNKSGDWFVKAAKE